MLIIVGASVSRALDGMWRAAYDVFGPNMFQLNFFLYFFAGIGVLSIGCLLMGLAADDLGGRLDRALRRNRELRKRRRMNRLRIAKDRD
jgi:hypothetical protein